MWATNKRLDREVQAIAKTCAELHSRITALERSQTNSPSSAIVSRLEDLELWRGKIQEMAIQKTPTGRETFTKFGKRMFGGRS